MITNATTHHRRASLSMSAVFWGVGASIVGFVGWLSFSSGVGSAWKAVSLVAASGALVGLAWYLLRERTERRWRAALDHYAEQEQAKETNPRKDSRSSVTGGEPIQGRTPSPEGAGK
jgi:apolipoprotein N-acyltransferase